VEVLAFQEEVLDSLEEDLEAEEELISKI